MKIISKVTRKRWEILSETNAREIPLREFTYVKNAMLRKLCVVAAE